jgi:hypothetical protein
MRRTHRQSSNRYDFLEIAPHHSELPAETRKLMDDCLFSLLTASEAPAGEWRSFSQTGRLNTENALLTRQPLPYCG